MMKRFAVIAVFALVVFSSAPVTAQQDELTSDQQKLASALAKMHAAWLEAHEGQTTESSGGIPVQFSASVSSSAVSPSTPSSQSVPGLGLYASFVKQAESIAGELNTGGGAQITGFSFAVPLGLTIEFTVVADNCP